MKKKCAIYLYQLLVKLYPKAFRAEYEALLIQTFKDMLKLETPKIIFKIVLLDYLHSLLLEHLQAISMEEKQHTSKSIKPIALIYTVFIVFVFSLSYFANYSLDFYQYLALFCLPALFYWNKYSMSLPKKILYIFATCFIATFIGLVAVFSTMFLPGSREHNYVMYSICLPEIDKYYQSLGKERAKQTEVDAQGYSRWWHQHTECEENVWAGKGPIFSENPPNFIPVSN